MSFSAIRMEGGLFSPDFLTHIHEKKGQEPKDFDFEGKLTLTDEISSAWAEARARYNVFVIERKKYESAKDSAGARKDSAGARKDSAGARKDSAGARKDSPTGARGDAAADARGESPVTIARKEWMLPFFKLLGYDLKLRRKALEADGKSYAISHVEASGAASFPVHIAGFDQGLGDKSPGGLSPHSLVQEYLNRSDAGWGLVTNGLTLRLLRNSSLFTRQSYLEFDLEEMLAEERFDEFVLLFRVLHRSRLPKGGKGAHDSLLEEYHAQGVEEGGRIRDKLRDAVKRAIRIIAEGFLNHKQNGFLRDLYRSGELTSVDLFQEALYLVYRLLFLFVAEERNLIGQANRETYRAFGPVRLRALAGRAYLTDNRHHDYYLQLRALFFILGDEATATAGGFSVLNGDLFKERRVIDRAALDNGSLMRAFHRLSYFRPDKTGELRRVNYSALNVEELGSVYESLLDIAPIIEEKNGRFEFALEQGQERKSTGSYYTHHDLVAETIKSALLPVIKDRLAAVSASDPREEKKLKAKAILDIKVCDPACGSGHFLLAASRALGRELAKFRHAADEPSPEELREAVRTVISHCIYGVDKNPLAVDLCKVALWIEGFSEGKPLTFLDHRIRCGDSLVGVFDLNAVDPASASFGIPDGAYSPVTGDDKGIANQHRTRNMEEREGQQELVGLSVDNKSFMKPDYSVTLLQIENRPDDDIDKIRKKQESFAKLREIGGNWWREETACHLWTAAFFSALTPKSKQARLIPTTGNIKDFLNDSLDNDELISHAWNLANANKYFHWPLEFPDVFGKNGNKSTSGFDVIMGNPPYVMMQNMVLKGFSSYVKCMFDSAAYKNDTYQLFLEKAISLVKEDGFLGYLTPNTYLNNVHSESIRRLLLEKTELKEILMLKYSVFPDASVEVCITIAQKRKASERSLICIKESCAPGKIIERGFINQKSREGNSNTAFHLNIMGDDERLLQKITRKTRMLGDFCDAYFGIQTRDRNEYVKTKRLDETYVPVVDGGNIEPFISHPPVEFLKFVPEAIKSGGDQKIYMQERIGVRQIGRYPIASILPAGVYALNTIYNVYDKGGAGNLHYLLGLINSSVVQYYWIKLHYDEKLVFPKIKKKGILSIPIREYSGSHDLCCSITDLSIDLQECSNNLRVSVTERDKAFHKRRKEKLYYDLNEKVFDLYELNEEDRKKIEKALVS